MIEFWIDGFKIGPDESVCQNVLVATIPNMGRIPKETRIHVIEFSEYEKLKAENDELKRIIDLQKTEYNDLLEPHFVEKIEKLSKKCEVLSEAVKEIKFHEDKYIQNSNEISTMYLGILNKALAEAESIK